MGWADTGIFGGFLTLADRRIWDWQTLTKVWFLLTVRSGSCLDRWQPKREIKTLLFLNLKIYKKVAWIRWHHLHLQWKFKLLAGKFTWVNKAKHCWALSTIFCWHHPATFCLITSRKLSPQWFEFSLKVGWWDQIQAIFLFFFYFKIGWSAARSAHSSKGFVG